MKRCTASPGRLIMFTMHIIKCASRTFWLKMTPAQCRAARALLGVEQSEVAESAAIHRNTLVGFEKGEGKPRDSTIAAIRAALESAGVCFIEENGGGAGVRLCKYSHDDKT